MIRIERRLRAVHLRQVRPQLFRAFATAISDVKCDDLARLPDNGWSLFGLAESLREQKKAEDEVAATKAKFQQTWARADTKITTSCLCQAGK